MDYTIIRGIYKKTNLNILDISKVNIRLIYILVYLSQFELDIRYYLGYLNIILNTLSYLKVIEIKDISSNNKLEYIFFISEIIIEL
jgi:hypothetical protein